MMMNNGNAGGCIYSNKDKNFKANHNSSVIDSSFHRLYL